jgi:hypothetical protein
MYRRNLLEPTDARNFHGAQNRNVLTNPATMNFSQGKETSTPRTAVCCAGTTQTWTHEETGGRQMKNPNGLWNLTQVARDFGRNLVGAAFGLLNALNGTTSCPLPTFAS